MKKYNIGYTTGVYDLFHIGHLNILKRAKDMCEQLIVGVCSDELVLSYKNKKPIIPYQERIEIVRSIKYVDRAIIQTDRDKVKAFKALNFNALFLGDDWKASEFYNKTEKELKLLGVDLIFLPYTKNVSSTFLKEVLQKIYKE